MAAVNNSDSELNLKKVFISLTVHSQADICRYMYTYSLPPSKREASFEEAEAASLILTIQMSSFEFAMTAELQNGRRIFYSLSQREKYLFITLSIVYIQISNTYLPVFLNIVLYVEANPVCVVNVCNQR